MKNYFITAIIFFLLLSGNIFKLYAQNNLSVVFHDGLNEQIPINTINNIKFSNNGINIKMGTGSTTTYTLSTIRKLIFKTASGFNDLTDKSQQIQLYPNPVKDILFFRNIHTTETIVKIYSTSGVEVINELISSTMNSINVNQLEKGLYLLKINNQVIKFSRL